MGDFTLGCLLGQYDRAQSFDVASKAIAGSSINRWYVLDAGGGGFREFLSGSTVTHSSAQGLYLQVSSRGSYENILSYAYDQADDAWARRFPEVAVHAFQVDLWANVGLSAASGDLIFDFNDIVGDADDGLIPGVGLAHYRRLNTVGVTSASMTGNNAPVLRFLRLGHLTNSVSLVVDDVIAQLDLITLHPDHAFVERQRLLKADFRSREGTLYTARWGSHGAWTLPLRFLTGSHANLINWWWENQFNLALTLDTSDSESIRTVRIVNETQPIGSKIRPYPYAGDGWQGVLELESLDRGSLVF